jgi:hypothetical protein
MILAAHGRPFRISLSNDINWRLECLQCTLTWSRPCGGASTAQAAAHCRRRCCPCQLTGCALLFLYVCGYNSSGDGWGFESMRAASAGAAAPLPSWTLDNASLRPLNLELKYRRHTVPSHRQVQR